jgi:carboxyl-terminal processing protease
MNTNKKALYLFLLTLFLAIGILIGRKLTPSYLNLNSTGTDNYNKIRDIIQVLDEKYVDTVNANKLFEQTINDLLHKLDPHSAYISKEDLQASVDRVEGVFGGIGVRFFMLRDTVSITNVIKNSPSERAGLVAGDQIIKVEGKLVSGVKMVNDSIMKRLKGQPNTPVNVTLLRNGQLLNKKIIRGLIPYNSIAASYMLEKGIGYVKIDEFSKTTGDDFIAAVNKLQKIGLKKVIIDLRSNGGGVLQSAIQIVDAFLPKGKLILTTKGKNFPEEKIYSTGKGTLQNVSVAIILNESSASASEIVAGALQDQDRAIIIGRRSFGKGLVQQDIPLRDGSDLRLVVARYYTPSGRCIQKPYSGNYEDYMKEYYDRYEDGEVYHGDTAKVADSLIFHTAKGRKVYGGGGIYPDVFVPLDSTKNSWYVAELYYKGVFQSFAFDYVRGKRSEWKTMYDFKTHFNVSDQLVQQFMLYVAKNFDVVKDKEKSTKRIKEILKAEIARQLWEEQGYYYVNYQEDKEIMKGIQLLAK